MSTPRRPQLGRDRGAIGRDRRGAIPRARRARSAPTRCAPAASGCGRCCVLLRLGPRGAGACRCRGSRRARPHGHARPRRPDRRRAGAPRKAGRLGSARRRRSPGNGRLPLRASIRRARRRGRRQGGRRPRGRVALPRPGRGDAAPPAQRSRHDRSRPTSNAARSRPASSSRPPARSAPAATLGRFGLNLGIAFQIADDILDCSGDTIETGKVAGTDLREGTPTLPLLLAAREDDAVRAALAGGPIEGVLVRVAATGALERSRQVALDYAREARESLNGGAPPGGARVTR